MENWIHRFSWGKRRDEASVTGKSKTRLSPPNIGTSSSLPTTQIPVRDGRPKLPSTPDSRPHSDGQVSTIPRPNALNAQRHDGSRWERSGEEKKDYWQMAVQQLQEEDPCTTAQIEAIKHAAVGGKDKDLAAQLVATTEKSRKALEAKRMTIVVGSKVIRVREQVDRIVKGVLLIKDIANAAASVDPLHAGIPVAGLCVLLQMTISDSEQYAAMLDGVDEIVTVIARYREIETLYRSQLDTDLKQEFEKRLVSLYKHIINYHINAAGYYQRRRMVRILRSFPKCDDVSPILATIHSDDRACKEITQVFDSKKLDQVQELLMGQRDLAAPSAVYPVHRTGSRSTNDLFTGRDDLLHDLEKIIGNAVSEPSSLNERRIVITGMGGLGKSELCLQLAHRLQSLFWGIFWIDVSTDTLAAAGYAEVAKRVGIPAQTWQEARQGVANLQKPWLLVLDNADDPEVDYAPYFPGGSLGVSLLTSRNAECRQHATTKHIPLDALTDAAAQELLLNSALLAEHENEHERQLVQQDAAVVASLLRSHPLAIIQAGAYISRRHCSLKEYPAIYERQRQRLLAFHPTQARSRYGDVYTTFEASAIALQSSNTEVAKDALELLPLLAVYETNQLPLSLFEAAWEGAQTVIKSNRDDTDIGNLTRWHTSHLPLFIQAESVDWDSFRLVEAIHLLKAFSLVSVGHEADAGTSVSMHPLIHAWARDRQNKAAQHNSWLEAGCVVAITSDHVNLWRKQARQLQPHLQALVSWNTQIMFASEPVPEIMSISINCGWLLNTLRDDRTLFRLMQRLCIHLGLSQSKVDRAWLPLYDIISLNYRYCGEIKQAIELLEQLVEVRKQTLVETHPDRLASQHALAQVYQANGQLKEATQLLEEVVRIREKTLVETHPDRLASQHELAGVYKANGQLKEATQLLEEVVRIEEKTLVETHPDRLASQHELARVYQANGQLKEATQLLEEVVRIREKTMAETHPDRLVSQLNLAVYYWGLNSRQEAYDLMKHVVEVYARVFDEHYPNRQLAENWLKDFDKTMLAEKS